MKDNNKYFNCSINNITDGLGKLKVFLPVLPDGQCIWIILSIIVGRVTMFDIEIVNSGDQNNNSIPEVPVCEALGILLLVGLRDKIKSSSWLLDDQIK